MSECEPVRTHSSWFEALLLWLIPLFAAVLALTGVAAVAEESDQSVFVEDVRLASPTRHYLKEERWGVAYENDFFVPGGRDQDYTYGLSFSYSREDLSDKLHKPLLFIDNLVGFRKRGFQRLGYEAGLYGFTPEDTSIAEANPNDRPYASLVYFATSRERIDPRRQHVLRSQLSYGVLGLDVVGQVQKEFHKWIGNEQPEGWAHQISAGGEPTLRYSLSFQDLLSSGGSWDLHQTQAVSVGYLTEASWGVNFRLGQLNSRWHDFSPDLASYAEASARHEKGRSERFLWLGMSVKARAYNAFLQGQFKDSEVSYSSDELNHVLLEAWAGYTHSFASGYYFSYGVRGHSSEVKDGQGNRNVIWGGLMFGHRHI
ncbi:lipid A deacylase LpxR family protein [Agaribacterium haliotis]|uniref:lipid A deacylase LpxR family protein n=1 Tax=Agaribacterium haliotis TaxID=2013869 RepID=UPI000BB52F8D|nr:lipid A deacylase LpxR family protein [Agaribacterium haliotis]